jgi:hypothetical protein
MTIRHTKKLLEVERVVFVPREIQPLVRYRFSLDGPESENTVSMGRSGPPTVSTTSWEGDRLTIATRYPFQDADGRWLDSEVLQTLWLQPASGPPFEPSLVVETLRRGVLDGPSSTTRTVYNRGYR